MFAGDRCSNMSLAQCIALTLRELVAANLGLDSALLDAMPAGKHPVVPG